MKCRGMASILLAFAIVLAMSVTAFGAVVYDGTEDMKAVWTGDAAYIGYEDKIAPNGSGRLCKAGEPNTSWTDEDGLKVGSLQNSWDAVDFLLGDLNGSYTLVVEFAAADSKNFGIVDADSPYADLATAEGTSVTIEYKFTAENGKSGSQNRFRLNNLTDRSSFFIKSIMLYDDAGAAEAAPAAADDTPAPHFRPQNGRHQHGGFKRNNTIAFRKRVVGFTP